MIIEWNHHLFSSDTRHYPFHPRAVYVPEVAHEPNDPLETYLAHLQRVGIDRAVVVQPEPYGDDHRLVLDCLRRAPDQLRATALFYPRDDDAPLKLAALVKQEPRIVAVRFHAHRGKEMYLHSFGDAGVRNLWRAAADLAIMVELHIGPNYAQQAGEAIAAFPDVPVLIDHLAEPAFGNAAEYAQVLELARFENVWMKLSGVPHFSDDPPYFASAKPFVRRVAAEFGPDRMVWGGETPALVDALLPHWSEAERAQVKGGNLAHLFE